MTIRNDAAVATEQHVLSSTRDTEHTLNLIRKSARTCRVRSGSGG